MAFPRLSFLSGSYTIRLIWDVEVVRTNPLSSTSSPTKPSNPTKLRVQLLIVVLLFEHLVVILLMCFLEQLPHTACQLCQFPSDVPVASSCSLRPAQRYSLGHDASWTRTGEFWE